MGADKSRLLLYTAGGLLIVYLILLLGTTYHSQQQLREAANHSLHAELQKRAAALSYFYSERKADVRRLAQERVLTVFFSNRALGMSMEYGLRTSLLAMRELAQEMVDTRTIERTAIYRRILIQDMEGEVLVDVGSAAGRPAFWTVSDEVEPDAPALQVSDRGDASIYLVDAVSHRGARVGTIIAQVDHHAVTKGLLHHQGDASEYIVVLSKAAGEEAVSGGASDLQAGQGPDHSEHSEPIPETPFEIALVGDRPLVGGLLASPGYMAALALLALGLLILLGIMASQIRRRERDLIASRDRLTETNAQLRASQKQLVQSEKMASLGILAAGVAHEINNPIGFIIGNLSTLQDYKAVLLPLVEDYRDLVQGRAAEEPELLQRWEARLAGEDLDFLMEDLDSLVADTVEGARRVAEIVSGLRSFAHGGEDRNELVQLNECVAAALSLANNELKYKAEVELQLGELPLIKGSSGQITQVLVNLLVNAAQAIEGQGKVRVETRRDGDSLVAQVKDTGCGIPPEHLDQLFTPFFTTKEVGKGTGLGLSISQGIVEGHGGSIRAESEPGHGSVLTLIFPVGPDELVAISG